MIHFEVLKYNNPNHCTRYKRMDSYVQSIRDCLSINERVLLMIKYLYRYKNYRYLFTYGSVEFYLCIYYIFVKGRIMCYRIKIFFRLCLSYNLFEVRLTVFLEVRSSLNTRHITNVYVATYSSIHIKHISYIPYIISIII